MTRTIRYQGAIIRDHHILLIKQTEHASGRSYWLIPGGRIEADETEESCVRREMQEETGLHVHVQYLLLDEPGMPGGTSQRKKTYVCYVLDGEARPGYEPEEEFATAYSFTEVGWFDLRHPTTWNEQIVHDPITYPLLQRIQAALGYADMAATKVDIDVSLVSQLVAAQFPQWADLPIKPVEFDGWDNRTFRLGEDMSVRLPSAEGYAAQVEKEHRWLPRLAPILPLPIPVPLAMGIPTRGYPWHWSVYRWLEGESATIEGIADLPQFATTLARFLAALQQIDPAGGPPPGQHNFFRGGPLSIYDGETRQAIAALDGKIDTGAVTAVWEAALKAPWHGSPVWLHGDVSAGNLLVERGRLSAVIDFGCSGVGDPACDVTIAWTLLSGESREAFRAALPLDGATWARGRGWALWKGLITLAEHINTRPLEAEKARRVIDEVLADHKRAA